MTDLAAPAYTGLGAKLGSAVAGTLHRAVAIYRLGGRALTAAPALVVLAIVPELAQHVVEIRIGMFASLDAFHALANDPTRWAFGYVKVAGFLLAILAVARFWAVGGVLAQVPRLGWRGFRRVVLGTVLTLLASLPLKPLLGHGAAADAALMFASLVLQTALTVYIVGALLGDGDATLRRTFTAGWPRALFLTLLLAAAFLPCQALHMANHRLALGAPAPALWALMAWDGLFVGLFAALVGSAMFVGYRYGPSWRGWDRPLDV